jgi:hypothetical protein
MGRYRRTGWNQEKRPRMISFFWWLGVTVLAVLAVLLIINQAHAH